MIADAIEFVRKEVRDKLSIADDQVAVRPAKAIVDENNFDGAFISLVNVQEETALRNRPHVESRMGQLRYVEPPVYLNLYMLFAFSFSDYSTSLLRLSKVVEIFQAQRWYGPQTQVGPGANPFPATLEKLVFEMVNLNFEELNNLWGVLGGTYFPSVVYKVRLVKVQLDAASSAPEITGIQLDTVVR